MIYIKTLLTSLVIFTTITLAAYTGASHGEVNPNSQLPSWTQETWTQNNQAYRQIRDSIDRAVAKGESPTTLAVSYKTRAEANPYKPLEQFRWAYALRKSALTKHPLDLASLVIARDALSRATPPHVYDYTRLRFLVESEMFPGQELKIVGERVVHHDPQDEDARYQIISILSCSRSLLDKKHAVDYAQSMVQLNPNNADYHANLAGAYLNIWFRNKSRADADKAIREYQAYLKLAPANAEYRRTAERLIGVVQKAQAK